MHHAPFSGIYPVLYCFFDSSGRIDRNVMSQQVEYCLANGAQGITVLGLVSEVHKMDVNERLEYVQLVGELIASRVPYAVTVCEPSINGQVEFSNAAAAAGADWLILQPPAITGMGQADLVKFFGSVADAVALPVAIQNNPVNLPVSLSAEALIELNRRHANITLLKGEGYSVDIARVIEGTQGKMAVFGGHGGIEFMSLLRSGGSGLIPAPDFLRPQVALLAAWNSGTPEGKAEAERIHRNILPAIVFMSRSVPGMLCYGKRLFARQVGITDLYERAPAAVPTAFGLAEIDRFAADIRLAV